MSLSDHIQGDRLAFIGIGGGSDCIQAAILSRLSGKPSCVISIRADKTSSQDASGKMGVERTVEHHGGEIADGVYRITPETTGSGRFFESIPATGTPTYLVVDKKDGRLTDQIQAALTNFGGVQSIVALDTGGDALYRASVSDQTKATPDQDLASLKAVSQLRDTKLYSMIMAPGVDTPDDYREVLQSAQAHYMSFDEAEKARIFETYKEFEMDGSNPDRYGKTSLAWQAALRGERGSVRLPLPDHVVNDPRNPWNPYVNITEEMAGAYVMDVEKHISAIQHPKKSRLPADYKARDADSLRNLGAGNTTDFDLRR